MKGATMKLWLVLLLLAGCAQSRCDEECDAFAERCEDYAPPGAPVTSSSCSRVICDDDERDLCAACVACLADTCAEPRTCGGQCEGCL